MIGDVAAGPRGHARRCDACGEPLVGRSGAGEVTHGTVAVVATGPVAWACPRRGDDAGRRDDPPIGTAADRHQLVAPTRQEVAAAVRAALQPARRTRLRGTLRCGSCDEPFALPGRRTVRSVTVTGDAPTTTITFDLPVLRCTQDAIDNVPPESLADALAACEQLLGGAS